MTKRFITTLLALPLALSTAYAQDTSGFPTSMPAITVSGYGTLALTQTNDDGAQFARPNQASGAGKSARTGIDSNFGVQANTNINNWLSATVQGLARKDAEDDFGAELAWAFVKAKVNDKLSVRVGRMGMPVFLISDYRNVGYANTMVRPPSEVYVQVPINNIDGIDATWQQNIGDTSVSAQLAYGRTQSAVSGGVSHVEATHMSAFNLVAENGPLTLRFGRADAKLSLDDVASLNTLLGTLRTVGAAYKLPTLAPLASDLEVHKKKAAFTSVGMIFDWNNILVQSEYAKRKVDAYINDTNSWYVMAGYRFGKVLPYYSHAHTNSSASVTNTAPTSCPAGSPAACTPTVRALSAGIDTLLKNTRQSTDTIGVRWDFYRSMALKAQIDRVRPESGNGTLIKVQPGFKGPVTVGAVALDFVF